MLFDELILSYSLLFGQSDNGMKVLATLLDTPVKGPIESMTKEDQMQLCFNTSDNTVDVRVIGWTNDLLREFGALTVPPSLDDFRLFGGRLERIQREMHNWRPRRLRDLLRPGYGDRFMWYTQMFALGIAGIGIFVLFLSIIQTAFAIKSYYDSLNIAQQNLEVAIMGLNVSLQALNVSLQALGLQRLQMNLTL
jgi:hypothetical protein